jgi:DNA repair protein RecO (recombination protein O)
MEWDDSGILLSARPQGETAAIAILMTRDHGRHAGLVHGGQSRRLGGLLQPGNQLSANWQARLAEQLGTWRLELEKATAAGLLDEPARLAALASACALTEAGVAEREPHPALYEGLAALLQTLGGEAWAEAYVYWEIGLLGEIGFGLDLSSCAVTGSADDLTHVSPRTGRAVSAEAAAPYRERLLPLPGFLVGRGAGGPEEVLTGLALTGHFLERHVFALRHEPVPPARDRFVERYRRTYTTSGGSEGISDSLAPHE